MQLSKKLKAIRIQQNLSQEQFAEELAVTRQAVSKWEAGRSIPDIENLMYISDLYKVSLDSLVKGDNDVEKKLIADSAAKKWHYLIIFYFVALIVYIVYMGLWHGIWMVGLGVSALFMIGIELWLVKRCKPFHKK